MKEVLRKDQSCGRDFRISYLTNMIRKSSIFTLWSIEEYWRFYRVSYGTDVFHVQLME